MIDKHPTVADLIQTAAGGGWEWFDQMQNHLKLGARPKSEAEKARDADARRALAEGTARIFDSEDGAILLEHMVEATFRRIVFFTQLGVDPQQALLQGAFREGMCAIVAEILKLIAEGRQVAAPKTRER